MRAKVQACLTLLWTYRLPIITQIAPSALLATTLQDQLGDSISQYTYVDFCAGAGGPTPYIERDLNERLKQPPTTLQKQLDSQLLNGFAEHEDDETVDFVLTDIAPHLPAWTAASKRSRHLHYVEESVDAANAPPDLVRNLPPPGCSNDVPRSRKIFRLYSLAFHHFPDALAQRILSNTFKTSSGFGIFELQSRTVSALITCTLTWPLLLLISPFYFWRDPGHLFFTYVIPIVPFVVVVDGYTSCLRTRERSEIEDLVEGLGTEKNDWELRSGRSVHTWPIGELVWLIGTKKD